MKMKIKSSLCDILSLHHPYHLIPIITPILILHVGYYNEITGNDDILLKKGTKCNIPDSKVHGANMGPTQGQQDPGGPHVGPMNFAIWDASVYFT